MAFAAPFSCARQAQNSSYNQIKNLAAAGADAARIGGANRWLLLVYLAAFAGVGAQIGVALTFGWTRGDWWGASAVWMLASVLCVIGFSVAFSAMTLRIKGTALPALFCLVIFGAFNFATGLGAATSGRQNATRAEQSAEGDRKRAQATFDTAKAAMTKADAEGAAERKRLQETHDAAKADLDALPDARLVDTVTEIIASPTKRSRKAERDLQQELDTAKKRSEHKAAMDKASGQLTELNRAPWRKELQATMDRATAELKAIGTIRVSNGDVLGVTQSINRVSPWQVSNDVVSELLSWLAVLVLECGPGAVLALAEAYRRSAPPAGQEFVDTPKGERAFQGASSKVGRRGRPAKEREEAKQKIVDTMKANGGSLSTKSARVLGDMLSVRKSTAHNALAALIAAGVVAEIGSELILCG